MSFESRTQYRLRCRCGFVSDWFDSEAEAYRTKVREGWLVLGGLTLCACCMAKEPDRYKPCANCACATCVHVRYCEYRTFDMYPQCVVHGGSEPAPRVTECSCRRIHGATSDARREGS